MAARAAARAPRDRRRIQAQDQCQAGTRSHGHGHGPTAAHVTSPLDGRKYISDNDPQVVIRPGGRAQHADDGQNDERRRPRRAARRPATRRRSQISPRTRSTGGMPVRLSKQTDKAKAGQGWVQPRPDRSSTVSTTCPLIAKRRDGTKRSQSHQGVSNQVEKDASEP